MSELEPFFHESTLVHRASGTRICEVGIIPEGLRKEYEAWRAGRSSPEPTATDREAANELAADVHGAVEFGDDTGAEDSILKALAAARAEGRREGANWDDHRQGMEGADRAAYERGVREAEELCLQRSLLHSDRADIAQAKQAEATYCEEAIRALLSQKPEASKEEPHEDQDCDLIATGSCDECGVDVFEGEELCDPCDSRKEGK